MVERERQREREAEARDDPFYRWGFDQSDIWRERATQGEVVIKGKSQPWTQGRQALVKWFMHPLKQELAVNGWLFFMQDIRSHSGRHVHQGGLAIYVVEGKGWTTVDGVRHDWEEGDLILLPVKAKGVEHQHFNANPGSPCKWLAMIYTHFYEALCCQHEQKEVSPDFGKAHA
ncbi:MAG: cupin domain-containing protein [Dehalococcoidia bacterium]|nr:cupin domain-containing protein [Dehalococcoidia bacterium]